MEEEKKAEEETTEEEVDEEEVTDEEIEKETDKEVTDEEIEEEKEETTVEENNEEVEVDEEPTKVYNNEPVKEVEEEEEEESVSMEEYREMKKSRNHIIYALLIIIIAFGIYITYNEFVKNKNKEPEPTVKEEQKQEEKKQEPTSNIVETSTEKELTKKMHTLFGSSGDEIKNDRLFLAYNPTIPVKNIFTNSLTEENKELIALQNTEGKEIKNDNPESDDYMEKSVSDFKIVYKNLFGSEPQKLVSLTGCPAYRYEKDKNRFVLYGGCGFVGGLFNMIYIDDIDVTDSKAIVKTYIGGFSDNGMGDEAENQVYAQVLYGDEKEEKLTPIYNTMTFIDNTNKTKFPSYNFIFTKFADGKYYFTKVEKAS